MTASLSFLGLGVPPTVATWGSMLNESRAYMVPSWWVCYPEGNHVCNNIIYKYRPLVADFMAQHLRA